MNPEHIKVLVAKRMQQAAECLDDGRYLLSAGRGARTAVNRAYYAAFYVVLALLQTIGKTPRKHKGALALFDTEFIKTSLATRGAVSHPSSAFRCTPGGRLSQGRSGIARGGHRIHHCSGGVCSLYP
jgi:uncharacterized protein (UPF0332 family)